MLKHKEPTMTPPPNLNKNDYDPDFLKNMLTVNEFMEYLHLSRTSIYRLRKQGMPYHILCNKILFNKQEITEWMLNNRNQITRLQKIEGF